MTARSKIACRTARYFTTHRGLSPGALGVAHPRLDLGGDDVHHPHPAEAGQDVCVEVGPVSGQRRQLEVLRRGPVAVSDAERRSAARKRPGGKHREGHEDEISRQHRAPSLLPNDTRTVIDGVAMR